MKSAWLAEFHRQWQRARGSRLDDVTAAFSRDWAKLLSDAGTESAEDIRHAEREAESLAASGHVKLVRYRHRLIRRIQLPVASEAWFRSFFASEAPRKIAGDALTAVEAARQTAHPLLPKAWPEFCGRISDAFSAGRSLRPFRWPQPEAVRGLLSLLHDLTSREWPPCTLVRDACVAIGRETKAIERHLAAVESALTLLFQRPMSLDGLGIVTANSRLLFDGPLTLEFADGSRHEAGHLRHGDFVTAADLTRAVSVTTSAARILTVENSKTTFRTLAAQNEARQTLLVATSFPTQAVRLLLKKLPLDLPHCHFGDTDPAGYFILAKLREVCPRPVPASQMDWRDDPGSPVLTDYDRRVLGHLLTDSNMDDVKPDLHRMAASGRKGLFEQEFRSSLLAP